MPRRSHGGAPPGADNLTGYGEHSYSSVKTVTWATDANLAVFSLKEGEAL